jgi:hypothetical protein
MKLQIWERASKCAARLIATGISYQEAQRTGIDDKTVSATRLWMAIAWKRGYQVGYREGRRAARIEAGEDLT